jgi:hypothetical protein
LNITGSIGGFFSSTHHAPHHGNISSPTTPNVVGGNVAGNGRPASVILSVPNTIGGAGGAVGGAGGAGGVSLDVPMPPVEAVETMLELLMVRDQSMMTFSLTCGTYLHAIQMNMDFRSWCSTHTN